MSLYSNKFMLASLLSLPLHKYNDRVREWSWILDTSLTMNNHWRSNYYWTKVIYSVAYLVSELPLRPKDTYSFTYTIKSIYLVSTTHGNYCTIQNRDNTHTKCKVLGTGVIRERLIDEAKYSNSSHWGYR